MGQTSPAYARESAGAVHHLQRAAGNRATSRLLRSAGLEGRRGWLQASLTVGPPDDRWEREAERVAREIVAAGALRQAGCSCGGACCDGSEDGREASTAPPPRVRRLPARPTAAPAPPRVGRVVTSGGQPLPAEVRAFFEPRFGRDFGAVRIHTGREAHVSAEELGARAYTLGRHVVFADGEYRPETREGRRLIAHELVPTLQQGAAQGGGVVRAQGPAAAPATLAGLTARRVAFNNAGGADGDNCAAPAGYTLGVDQPRVGLNAMEMVFRIHGNIPAGTEFDITRTVADGLWQRVGGAWTRLGGLPAGTGDDRHDTDECLRPTNRRIFVIDNPGMDGTLNPRGRIADIGPVAAAADAAVWALSFAEWVIARNRRLGIGWTRISQPTFHRWHSILSVELVGGTWRRVDTPSGRHNEIELGTTAVRGATP